MRRSKWANMTGMALKTTGIKDIFDKIKTASKHTPADKRQPPPTLLGEGWGKGYSRQMRILAQPLASRNHIDRQMPGSHTALGKAYPPHDSLHKCPQPHNTHSSQQPHIAINIFMLKTSTMAIPANRLTVKELQDRPFHLAKRAVSLSETTHLAAQNMPFRDSKRHIRKS